MKHPRQTRIISALPASMPFTAPEQMEAERGAAFQARLGANELGFGPSPKALNAMQDALPHIWKYGTPDSAELRAALANRLGISASEITVGEGIDGLLGLLVRLYVEPGDPVVTSAGSYPTFNYHVEGFGGTVHSVPYKGDFEDPDALIAKAHNVGAKLLYMSNPNNPMGTVHSAEVLERMMDALPDGCMMILDEAYTEFAPESTRPSAKNIRSNVIRFRTFSKAYGLAGARIAYGMASTDVISAFDKIRNHFGMNLIAQAGALAALEDQDHLANTIQKVTQAKDRIAQIAQKAGFQALPSATNFVCIDSGRGSAFAQALYDELTERGVFLRLPGIAPLNRCIRVSVGLPHELNYFEEQLSLALVELTP